MKTTIQLTTDNPGLFIDDVHYSVEKTKYGNFETQTKIRNRTLIQSLFKEYKNSIFCEIGIFGGINLFANYDEAKKNNIKIIGIDPHEKIYIFNGVNKDDISDVLVNKRLKLWKIFSTNIENTIKKYKLNIKYIKDTSWNAYSLIEDNSIGILHVDGDHSYEGVKKDLELFYDKMKDKSLILMDDFKWKGIRRATLEFVNKNNLKLEPIFNGEKCKIYINKKK